MNLRRGKTHTDVSILTTAAASADLDVTPGDTVILLGQITGGADADITLEVRPYDSDGAIYNQLLPVYASTAAKHVAGVVRTTQVVDVRGIEKVQVRVTNNNAATKIANVSYFLSR